MLTYGRTGSTWLQRVLNLHPGLTLWGEHYGFLFNMAQCWSAFMKSHGQQPLLRGAPEDRAKLIGALTDPDLECEWINPFVPSELQDSFRQLLVHLFARELPEDVRWGFKEVRYQNEVVLRMLCELFPEGQVLLLRRGHASVLKSMVRAWVGSGTWNAWPAERRANFLANSLEKIRRQDALFAKAEAELGIRALALTYEGFRSDFDAEVQRLFRFLHLDASVIDRGMLEQVQHVVPPQARSEEPFDDLEGQIASSLKA